ncbi:XRE family transcriptional regulator [Chromobacterium haemolyticum]|nr:XRE family transcriptional regulator [Chromobacterium haemolyticum]
MHASSDHAAVAAEMPNNSSPDKWQDRARAMMIQKKLSQRTVAERMNRSQSTFACWLNGRNIPNLEDINQLARALEVSAPWLAYGVVHLEENIENRNIRRENLGYLINEYGTIRALAEAVDTAANYLSEIKNGVRDMGHKLARKIEERTSKPIGWLDRVQENNTNLENNLGTRIRKALDALSEKTGSNKTPNWLATQVGVSRPAAYKWLKNPTSGIDGENLYKVAKALQVSSDWLASGHGEMQLAETTMETAIINNAAAACTDLEHKLIQRLAAEDEALTIDFMLKLLNAVTQARKSD